MMILIEIFLYCFNLELLCMYMLSKQLRGTRFSVWVYHVVSSAFIFYELIIVGENRKDPLIHENNLANAAKL